MKNLKKFLKSFFSLKGFDAYNFIFIIVMLLSCQTFGQVKQDAKGNYYSITAIKKDNAAKKTGQTYTNAKGVQYPVYKSINDKLFIIMTSKKTGNSYHKYLKF